MTPDESQERQRVVEMARAWVGTPYLHAARIRGAGVDCAMLLAEVFHEAGLIPRIVPEYYPRDWHFHRDEDRYVALVAQFARPVESAPLPGDVQFFRFGRCFSHAGIVIESEGTEGIQIIHAYYAERHVTISNIDEVPRLKKRIGPVYRYLGWGVTA